MNHHNIHINRMSFYIVIFIAIQFFITMSFLFPAQLEAAYTIGMGTDVEIQGNYAYVAVTGTSNSADDVIWSTPPPAAQPSGLRVIDISDPESPEIVGGLNYSNSGINCLTVEDDLAYLAYSGGEGVKIIDLSDPEDPEIIGTIKNVYATEIVISQGYAYIADPESGLVIIDVSDPDSPVRVSRLNLEGSAWDIAVQGDFAYLTFEDDSALEECGLYVCDISDPEHPFLVDTLVVGTALDSNVPPGGWMKIELMGDYAYLLKQSVIIIVEVSDPENTTKEEIWPLPGLPPYSHSLSGKDLTGRDDYLYLAASGAEGQQKLLVVDISDPLDPEEVGDVSTYTTHKARAISLEGNYACLIGDEGFQIIDISDPDDPSVVGKIKSKRSSSGTTGTAVYGVGYYPMGYNSQPYYAYGAYGQPGYGNNFGNNYGYPINGLGQSGGYSYGYPGVYSGAGFIQSPGYGVNYPGYTYNQPGYSLGFSPSYYSQPGYGYTYSQPTYSFGWNQPSYGWNQPYNFGSNQPYFGYQQAYSPYPVSSSLSSYPGSNYPGFGVIHSITGTNPLYVPAPTGGVYRTNPGGQISYQGPTGYVEIGPYAF